MKKYIKNKKGITLIALVITVVIILILLVTTVKLIMGDSGLINNTEKQLSKAEKQKNKENIETENILKYRDGSVRVNDEVENCIYDIDINTNVTVLNQTLGEFPVVFSIVGTYNGETIYNDIVSNNIGNVGTSTINIQEELPKGTELTVSQLYSGANYMLETDAVLKRILDNENETIAFDFYQRWNGKIINNTGTY